MIARIAAVQAAPVYMDLERSLDKTISRIGEAASKQATVVVFPETFLPGYPAWLDCCRDVNLWNYEPIKSIYAQLIDNSVEVPGKETDALSTAAREHEIVLNASVHERVVCGRLLASL